MTDKELEEGLALVIDTAFLKPVVEAFIYSTSIADYTNHSRDIAKAALSYLREQGVLMEWRPIEEYDEDKMYEYVYGGHAKHKWLRIVKKYGSSGWYQTNANNTVAQIKTDAPTHFMPLPKPPTNDKE